MAVNKIDSETKLRRSLMDRLITASLSEGTPSRDAMLERWRVMDNGKSAATKSARGIEAHDH